MNGTGVQQVVEGIAGQPSLTPSLCFSGKHFNFFARPFFLISSIARDGIGRALCQNRNHSSE
jgi:hypothetical protein